MYVPQISNFFILMRDFVVVVVVVVMSQTLGWQPLAGRVAMQRCAASSVWLQERITLARYAHVRNFTSK